jgi:predicted nuclease of restriction endonuclease-like (RecB) superfamily
MTFRAEEIRYTPGSELSWSHYRLLMRIERPDARRWYASEASAQSWSVAALDRQISTLYFERLLSSQDKDKVQDEAARLIERDAPADPRDFIRDPYVLEFLGAQPGAALYERNLEQGLLDQLQKFLLELGKGFAFVARQKHLRIEDEDGFIDLVFYNYILKCFVLIELKVGKLAHQDVGQMDMYVRVYDEQFRQAGDTTRRWASSSVRNATRRSPATRCLPRASSCLRVATVPCCRLRTSCASSCSEIARSWKRR